MRTDKQINAPFFRNDDELCYNADGTGDRCIMEFFGGQGTLNVNSWMSGRYFAFVRYEVE